MKRYFAAAALAVLPYTSVQAVTITLDAETLLDASGDLFPTTGLIVLTAAPTGTFYGPTPTDFTGGDELLLAKWDLSQWATPGLFDDAVFGLTFTGDWNEGDLLRMYWYPTLTVDSTEPGFGAAYGQYSDPVGIDGSDAWVTPGESGLINLRFITEDASIFFPAGSNPSSSAWANLLTESAVPEPGTAVFGTCILLGFGLRRRCGRSGA